MKSQIAGVTLLLALVLAVAMVLPVIAAEGNETNLSMADNGTGTLTLKVAEANASPTMDGWDPDEPDAYEPGNVSFPAEDNYIFPGRIYTFVWTSDFPGNYVSIGIMPVETNESITWMFIGKDRPCDDRQEFCAPFLNEGVYRTVFAIDGEGEQRNFFGDTFFIEENQVYVPPKPEPPEPLVKPTPSSGWW